MTILATTRAPFAARVQRLGTAVPGPSLPAMDTVAGVPGHRAWSPPV